MRRPHIVPVRQPKRQRSEARKVLVIGAAGKTGRLVVLHALAAGHSVVALVHDTQHLLERPLPAAAVVVQADVHDLPGVLLAMTGCDAVIDTLGGRKPFLKTDLEQRLL